MEYNNIGRKTLQKDRTGGMSMYLGSMELLRNAADIWISMACSAGAGSSCLTRIRLLTAKRSDIMRKASVPIAANRESWGLRSVTQARMMHQFRMYIDRHNIRYIRGRFKKPGMTDEEALELYVHKPAVEGRAGRAKTASGACPASQ